MTLISSVWSVTQQSESSSLQKGNTEEQEHVIVARALQKFRLKARMSNIPFPIHFPVPKSKTVTGQTPTSTTSKILPLLSHKTGPSRYHLTTAQTWTKTPQKQFGVTSTANEPPTPTSQSAENSGIPRQHKFPAVGAAPYIPVGHFRAHHGIAPPVTIRNAVPCFSAPPRMGVTPLRHNHLTPQFGMPPPMCGGKAPPVTIRQSVPAFSAPEGQTKTATNSIIPIEVKENTASHEESKSPTKPLDTPSLPTEDKGSLSAANSICLPVPPPTQDEKAVSKSLEPGLKGLQI